MHCAITEATSVQNRATDPHLPTMKRHIVIDTCAANILFPASENKLPVNTRTVLSGRLIPAALLLSEAGREVTVMGEAGRDPLGQMILNRLSEAGADISCVDRYSDGASTPCSMVFGNETSAQTANTSIYHISPSTQWDSKWPRIDGGDTILFGGYFALQPRVRGRLTEFLTTARERGALIVYLPGFNPALAPTITKVMPALLENLEIADAVITATSDLQHIFHAADARTCFDRHISFYSPLMANVNPSTHTLTLLHRAHSIEAPYPESPSADGLLPSPLQPALFADALQQLEITGGTTDRLSLHTLETIARLTSAESLSANITL